MGHLDTVRIMFPQFHARVLTTDVCHSPKLESFANKTAHTPFVGVFSAFVKDGSLREIASLILFGGGGAGFDGGRGGRGGRQACAINSCFGVGLPQERNSICACNDVVSA